MQYVIENDRIRVAADPLKGTKLSLVNKSNGYEYMWSNPLGWPTIMFPLCGDFENNRYSFCGKDYHIPEHGFLRLSDLECVDKSSEEIVFRLCSNQETRRMYPFEFQFDTIYRLEENSVEIIYQIKNIGTINMYYSVGCHQGYTTIIDPSCDPADSYLEFEHTESLDSYLLQGMAYDGRREQFLKDEKTVSLSHMFDNGGIVLNVDEMKSRWITIRNLKSSCATKIEFPDAQIIVLSSLGGNPDFVCIEPWQGMFRKIGHDGELKTREGIIELEPGGIKHMCQRIQLI